MPNALQLISGAPWDLWSAGFYPSVRTSFSCFLVLEPFACQTRQHPVLSVVEPARIYHPMNWCRRHSQVSLQPTLKTSSLLLLTCSYHNLHERYVRVHKSPYNGC